MSSQRRWRLLALAGLFLGMTLFPWQVRSQPPVPERLDELTGYWVLEEPMPVSCMDNAVVAYDGYLYNLGGYCNARYDPINDAWMPLPPMPTLIGSPADGCLGYNAQGEPIVVLFPNVYVQDVLMVYNITWDSWEQRSVPSPLPSNGIWHHDIASDPAHNVCYISGGATYPGFGDRNTFYAYYPASNSAQQLPNFTTERNYHASWFIPQWGEDGYICIAGGYSLYAHHVDSTQCYDVAQGVWRPENADLGILPHQWQGMADALTVVDGAPQPWVLGGLVNVFKSNVTVYYDVESGDWALGPHLPYAVQRMEAGTLGNEVYVVGGDGGSIDPVPHNQHHVQDPWPACAEERVFFDDFEGEQGWTPSGSRSLWQTQVQSDTCGSLAAPFPSPNTAWYYGDEAYDCTYDTFGLPNEGYLTLDAAIPITEARYAAISFQSYEQTQCGDDPNCYYDLRFLQVSYDDGESWTALWRGGSEDAWYTPTIRTHVDPGDSLRLRFFFDSISSNNNDYLGWLVDNVEVRACYWEPETPRAGFQVGEPACLGAAVPFSNTTIGKPPITYTWAFGDGTASTQTHPVHLYPAAGRYTVTLTAANPYGTDSASQPVEVHPPPTAGFSVSPPSVPPAKLDASSPTGGKPDSPPAGGVGGGLSLLCAGTPFSFTNTTSGVSPLNYLWAFGDGVASTETHLNHTYTAAGVYTVVLTATDACGRDSATQSLLVEPQPTAAFSYTPAVPQPWEPVWFTDLSGGEPTTWYWDFGDGYLSLLQHPLHTYWQEGVYTATLAATNLCGRDTAEQVVHVGPCFQYDFDCDCDVDVADLMMVAGRWQCQVGDDCYDPLYDSNGDGRVDILDIMVAAAWWGWTCGT